MKQKCIYVSLVMVLVLSFSVFPQNQKKLVGLGLIIGEPTGLSGKLWLHDSYSVDGAAAWSFGKNPGFYFHSNFLLNFTSLLIEDTVVLFPYAGAGGVLTVRNDEMGIGFRVPLGITWEPEKIPLEIFLEGSLGMQLFPETKLLGGAGLGIRYLFRVQRS